METATGWTPVNVHFTKRVDTDAKPPPCFLGKPWSNKAFHLSSHSTGKRKARGARGFYQAHVTSEDWSFCGVSGWTNHFSFLGLDYPVSPCSGPNQPILKEKRNSSSVSLHFADGTGCRGAGICAWWHRLCHIGRCHTQEARPGDTVLILPPRRNMKKLALHVPDRMQNEQFIICKAFLPNTFRPMTSSLYIYLPVRANLPATAAA